MYLIPCKNENCKIHLNRFFLGSFSLEKIFKMYWRGLEVALKYFWSNLEVVRIGSITEEISEILGGVGWLGGWLEQLETRLTSTLVELKLRWVELRLSLANKKKISEVVATTILPVVRLILKDYMAARAKKYEWMNMNAFLHISIFHTGQISEGIKIL